MRILIGVALYPSEPTLHPLTEACVDALTAAENVPDGWEVHAAQFGGDDPALGHYANLCAKHNRMRERVLDEGYDALLSIEADMIVPANAAVRLAAVDADVAYGLYVSRSTQMWLLFTELGPARGLSMAANPEQAAAVFGQVVASKGAGMGCTLIHRRVLERVSFRLEPGARFADDWWFALDVAAAGLRQAHDTGLCCGHVLRDGLVAWPGVRRTESGEVVLHRYENLGVGRMAADRYEARYLVLRTLHLPSENRYAGPGEVVMLTEDAARVLMGRQAVTPATPPEEKQETPSRGRRAKRG